MNALNCFGICGNISNVYAAITCLCMFSATWARVSRNSAIELIEHPVTGTAISKNEFAAEFGPVLEEMDGTTASDYFDFYFTQCDVCQVLWRFRDEDARADFVDAAIEHKLLPSIKEYHAGETVLEKQQRVHAQQKKEGKKRGGTKMRRCKARSKTEQLQQSFDALHKKLHDPALSAAGRQSTEAKLKRVIALMDQTM